jgi:hypothetical protein
MTEWNVMCNVSKIVIDATNLCGELHTPVMNYPDMSKTIECFKSVDPEIKSIKVFVNGLLDITYMYSHDGNRWVAK